MPKFDYLIVGAGFAGSVCARVLADAGKRVRLIDQRPHIGGNAHDTRDAQGLLIHPYGPHIFHTNSKAVLAWLSRFTEWRFYEHRVLAQMEQQLLPIPINRTTINRLYGLSLSGDEVQAYLDSVREPREPLQTSEDVVLNSVGRDLCDKFFRGYTRKQWGLDLAELSAGVAARIPTRCDDDDRYFSDTYQLMPAQGYTAMFERMLDHPLISIELATDFRRIKADSDAQHLIYTGPIDAYFDHCYGRLPYRSLRFDHQHLPDVAQFQAVGTVNYPNDHDYTRITEFKHLTGQRAAGTSIVREYPQAEGDPFYPIPRPENETLYKRYQALADSLPKVSFVGRLAQYRYYNMDQIVAAALKTANQLLEPQA
ncbi:UDP-galactopyranose mutase [Paucibacter sp. M5-1]|uniref:UDP-galactopyranose mutase n=1 Tax=Paucibacter sp. M5-1 TaxID=3015998 RepID=UPI0022B85FBA|nr:UDP-galactopyranose mutase [Paucibacter sp. M5-1]MCZ7881104.1 UDP-galactopyranose mutase [Paucibacter sp. M5-1]